jgi:error-prone DNA polymerase
MTEPAPEATPPGRPSGAGEGAAPVRPSRPRRPPSAPYVELHCHSNFSFLDGASHPAELARRAAELGMPALALTDTGGVYGAVRFLHACREAGVRPLIGACLEVEGEELVLLARSRRGYSNLCRILSLAHRARPARAALRNRARTTLETVARYARDLFFLAPTDDERRLRALQEALGREQVLVELHDHLRPRDRWTLEGRIRMARRCRAGYLATNDVRFHHRGRRPLHDVLTAIRHRATLADVRHLLSPNAERTLKGAEEMGRLFADHPEALAATVEVAEACAVDLDFREARFPGYPVPRGETPFGHLRRLAWAGARRRYRPVTPAVAQRLRHELTVIERTGLAEFFLITWDLVRFARERGIPVQGRGSAADSIVAYVLGITRVDPIAHHLLFERFLHEEMTVTPDIDLDLSSAHREQVIRYVHERYGWERTGMVCNVVTFQPRLAVRQVGKALGFPPDLVSRLARGIDRWFPEDVERAAEVAGAPPDRSASRLWQHLLRLVAEIQGFPRHLSIHVGGMLITGRPLVEVVPVEPARTPGRVVVQLDKDDVEDLGLIKIDLLGLRTLSAVAETLDLVERTTGSRPDLDALPPDDPEVFEMCASGDTVGVFQIESRAQMMTLPRTRPASFDDLVVQVAIIRPGPIQGNAVHPYLRRRRGREEVTYPHPLLEPILRDTLGVILYQEQVIEIAMVAAGMSAAEADRFRRAMTRRLGRAELAALEQGFVAGCLARGLPEEAARRLFEAVKGFAVYGFCRSHAAAFARTTYETAWLKLHYPAEYYCGLLNHQPMGFYRPSALVEDAKRHGLRVLPVDVNASGERCSPVGTDHRTLRIGLGYVRDLGEEGSAAIVAERDHNGPFRSFEDFLERLRGSPVGPRALRSLIVTGAFEALGVPRRELLWRWQEGWGGGGLRGRVPPQAELRLSAPAPPLPAPSELERSRLEHLVLGLSTGRHPVHFHRQRLRALGALPSRRARRRPPGHRLRVGGIVITRQAPATAHGVRFLTLEDEEGQVNVVVRPEVYERHRRALGRPLLVVEGTVQSRDGVWSLLAEEITAVEGPWPAHGDR